MAGLERTETAAAETSTTEGIWGKLEKEVGGGKSVGEQLSTAGNREGFVFDRDWIPSETPSALSLAILVCR